MSRSATLIPRPRASVPHVSIIMPTFRHEHFIESCIRSVLAQSYGAWELIVANDASPDRTIELVERFAANDDRIHLISHESNYGTTRLGDTYNEALAQCRGELVAVLEGDDEWLPHKLEMQVPVFSDPKVVLSYADYDEVTTDGFLIARHGVLDAVSPGRSGPRENLHFFSTLTSFGSNTVMVRTDKLLEIGGFGNVAGFFVDYPTWLRLVPKGDFVRIPAVLGRWRRHPGSVAYASYEYATIELLERHFVNYLQGERANLSAVGIESSDIELLARKATAVLREKRRSAAYYEGKYHLMFSRRLKAIGSFCQAIFDPSTAPRHRLGALAGVLAAATSRRLLPYLGRITRGNRAQSPGL